MTDSGNLFHKFTIHTLTVTFECKAATKCDKRTIVCQDNPDTCGPCTDGYTCGKLSNPITGVKCDEMTLRDLATLKQLINEIESALPGDMKPPIDEFIDDLDAQGRDPD